MEAVIHIDRNRAQSHSQTQVLMQTPGGHRAHTTGKAVRLFAGVDDDEFIKVQVTQRNVH